MQKIAVYLDGNGRSMSFDASGKLSVFSKENDKWEIISEIPLTINKEDSINELREQIISAADKMGECRVIVGKSVFGLAFNVFNSKGYSIWEFDGEPQSFLDYIDEREEQQKKEEALAAATRENEEGDNFIQFEEVSDGCYKANLIELQQKFKATSKKLLIPFLNNCRFKELQLICGHIPPWIEYELDKYKLQMRSEKNDCNEYLITLTKSV